MIEDANKKPQHESGIGLIYRVITAVAIAGLSALVSWAGYQISSTANDIREIKVEIAYLKQNHIDLKQTIREDQQDIKTLFRGILPPDRNR